MLPGVAVAQKGGVKVNSWGRWCLKGLRGFLSGYRVFSRLRAQPEGSGDDASADVPTEVSIATT